MAVPALVYRLAASMLLTVAVLGFVLLAGPISRAKDTPLMRAVSRIHQICGKLRYYADEHSVFPGGATTNASIDALAAIGILAADDVAYLRSHQVEYHGFDLSRVTADVPHVDDRFPAPYLIARGRLAVAELWPHRLDHLREANHGHGVLVRDVLPVDLA